MASVCIKTIRTISAKLRLTSDKRQGFWMFGYQNRDMFEKLEYISICWKQAKGLYCLSATTFFLNWCILEQIVVYPIEKSKKKTFSLKNIFGKTFLYDTCMIFCEDYLSVGGFCATKLDCSPAMIDMSSVN